MPDSVFTKIHKGEIPGFVLYEDDFCFVILTNAPNNPGHVLIIPTAEIANWEDLPQSTWLHVMEISQFFGKLLKEVYRPPKIALAIVGLDISHAHVHIFSLFKIDDMADVDPDVVKPEDLEAEAKKIRTAIDNHGGVKL